MCLVYVIGNRHDRFSFFFFFSSLIVTAQLLNAALPYCNPRLVRDPSAPLPPCTCNAYVITLFADATIFLLHFVLTQL